MVDKCDDDFAFVSCRNGEGFIKAALLEMVMKLVQCIWELGNHPSFQLCF